MKGVIVGTNATAGARQSSGRHHYRVAADIGGTFTDIVLIGSDGQLFTTKVPSTPNDFSIGVVQGVSEILSKSAVAPGAITQVLNGSTVATNAILEGRGARTALVTTRGFRDVLEIRRIRVPRLYDPLYVKPAPLVPRDRRFEVSERIGPRGEILLPLAKEEISDIIHVLHAEMVEAVAVSFLHSYANPKHEVIVGTALREALPGVFVTISSDILPEIREYERTSTTVINAYVGPPVRRYVGSLSAGLRAIGIDAPLLIMQSGGGVLEADVVLDKPALIIECGPAAGVIGGAHVANTQDTGDLITFDMGGTTAKVSIIEDGRLNRTDEYEVGGGISLSSPLVKGGGYALKTPVIDISEIGAGGGSIVWFDKIGIMKVGPQSMGAVPGPACYDAGGDQATITDAAVVLGYINPEALAGGTVPINAEKAHDVIARKVAARLDCEEVEAAHGVFTIACANMVRSAKAVSTYRGRDPRDFALLAFGANGGVFATALASALQMRRAIVPPFAGVFSAIGLLASDIVLTVSNTYFKRMANIDPDDIVRHYENLIAEVHARFDPGGKENLRISREARLRYIGQAFELAVDVPAGTLTRTAVAAISDSFEQEHERVYGHRFSGESETQIISIAASGTIATRDVPNLAIEAATASAVTSAETTRPAYFGPTYGTMKTRIVSRAALSGEWVDGPLVVEEYEGTTVVPPDWKAALDGWRNIVIEPTLGDRSGR